MKEAHPSAASAAKRALSGTGVRTARQVHSNQTAPTLVSDAIRRNEGRLSTDGAFMVETGVHTGRSVQDKFVVDEPSVTDDIWWGKVNQPIPPEKFNTLKQRVQAYLQGQELFTQDLYAGADPEHRVRVRLVTTQAWNALFARNMFIRPPAEDLPGFEPDYVILHAPMFQADPKIDGVRSSTAVALSFEQKMIIIAGTEYAGEVKKSIFCVMNWLLPAKGVMPMHCSANIGKDGDVALFFGLSGTGKTTLSSAPERRLIGDDEHGWGPTGTFNFEGGCYAKVINLSKEAEPEIYAATHRFGSVLENVIGDHHGNLDLADARLTENTRSCYPVEFIPSVELSGRGGQPKNVFMLCCDA
ncbi:MAG TPA: phosphoenolpyruvate carboxykinase (ATP), partial [Rhodopila sp.]|nr:phosphoenolpyruvate carboxykinase (ATP) [Rhodopila sp.]